MKNPLIISAAAVLFFATSQICGCGCKANGSNISTAEIISFYDVPLVCSAASEIGCGSRAKPVLLEMEKNHAIKEAWLNRAGTVYAIVWADADKTNETAKPIFEKYKIDFKKISGKKTNNFLSSFREDGKWYRGGDVDKLSIEEAGVIANDAVTYAVNEKLLSDKEADAIKIEIENYLKTELIKVRTVDELYGNEGTKKFRNDLSDIIAKIIGKERADKITDLYMQKKSFEKKEKKSCCEKNQKNKSCCKNK